MVGKEFTKHSPKTQKNSEPCAPAEMGSYTSKACSPTLTHGSLSGWGAESSNFRESDGVGNPAGLLQILSLTNP